jgi:hypothetical protein
MFTIGQERNLVIGMRSSIPNQIEKHDQENLVFPHTVNWRGENTRGLIPIRCWQLDEVPFIQHLQLLKESLLRFHRFIRFTNVHNPFEKNNRVQTEKIIATTSALRDRFPGCFKITSDEFEYRQQIISLHGLSSPDDLKVASNSGTLTKSN